MGEAKRRKLAGTYPPQPPAGHSVVRLSQLLQLAGRAPLPPLAPDRYIVLPGQAEPTPLEAAAILAGAAIRRLGSPTKFADVD
jgi:hypothetical protein